MVLTLPQRCVGDHHDILIPPRASHQKYLIWPGGGRAQEEPGRIGWEYVYDARPHLDILTGDVLRRSERLNEEGNGIQRRGLELVEPQMTDGVRDSGVAGSRGAEAVESRTSNKTTADTGARRMTAWSH